MESILRRTLWLLVLVMFVSPVAYLCWAVVSSMIQVTPSSAGPTTTYVVVLDSTAFLRFLFLSAAVVFFPINAHFSRSNGGDPNYLAGSEAEARVLLNLTHNEQSALKPLELLQFTCLLCAVFAVFLVSIIAKQVLGGGEPFLAVLAFSCLVLAAISIAIIPRKRIVTFLSCTDYARRSGLGPEDFRTARIHLLRSPLLFREAANYANRSPFEPD